MSNQAVAQDKTSVAAGEDSFTPEQYKKIDAIIEKYKDKPGSLIPVLQQAQDVCGYLPHVVQRYIAKGMKMSPERGVRRCHLLFLLYAGAARQTRHPRLSRHCLLCETERRDPR